MRFEADFVPEPHAATVTEVFADAEFVSAVFDERTRQIHWLNAGASAVWAVCDGRRTIANIVDELVDILEQDCTVVVSSVNDTLDTLWHAGLLSSSPSP